MNRKFEQWLADSAGAPLREAESEIVRKFMRQIAGPVVVQLGEFGGYDLLSEYGFPVSIIVSGDHSGIEGGVAGIHAATEYCHFKVDK